MLKTEKYFLLLESKNLTKDITLEMLRCKDGTDVPSKYYQNAERVSMNVQKIKDYIEKKIGKSLTLKMTSGYRTRSYNDTREGAAKDSYHIIASAIDFKFENYPLSDTLKYAKEMMELGLIDLGGLQRYATFIHYDVRGYYATWNENYNQNLEPFKKKGDLSVYKPVNDDRGSSKTKPFGTTSTSQPYITSTTKEVKKPNKKYDLKNVDVDNMEIKIEDFKDLRIEGGHS
jgi:hypothetical protein